MRDTWTFDVVLSGRRQDYGGSTEHLATSEISERHSVRHANRKQRLSMVAPPQGNQHQETSSHGHRRGTDVAVPGIEVFRQQDDTEPIHLLQHLEGQRKFLLRILQGCPRMRVFDAIHHRIDAKLLIEEPFACEDRLETFRCQVVGLERLYTDKTSMTGWFIELTAGGRGETAGVLTTTNMDGQLQGLQIKVFEQLARLTRLKTLDLGYAWRNPEQAAEGAPRFYQNFTDGKPYVNYGNPIEGTLNLTPESGLDRLSTLTHLEVFGVKGVDFKLKPESPR